MKLALLFVVVYLACVDRRQVNAWGSDDFELFDLVEEINKNFYEVLNIKQVCSPLGGAPIDPTPFGSIYFYI